MSMNKVTDRVSDARAFSLIELLVVVAILSVLAALSFPAYKKVTMSMAINKSLSNLRQLYGGFQMYATDNENCYPAPYDGKSATWQPQIFAYLYPRVPTKSDSSHLWNTVFISPNALADYRRTGKTVPDATVCGYGMNRALPAQGGTSDQTKPKSVLRLTQTANQTVLLIDNRNAIAGGNDPYGDARYTTLASVATRYNGKYTMIYCDGHPAVLPLEQIPQAQSDVFWTGQ